MGPNVDTERWPGGNCGLAARTLHEYRILAIAPAGFHLKGQISHREPPCVTRGLAMLRHELLADRSRVFIVVKFDRQGKGLGTSRAPSTVGRDLVVGPQ